MKNPVDPEILTIYHRGHSYEIAEHDGRGYAVVGSLCKGIGIAIDTQQRRLRGHQINGLKLIVINRGGETDIAIPLEEIAWFLRTLRPSDPVAQHRLAPLRNDLAMTLIRFFITRTTYDFVRWDTRRRILSKPAHDKKPKSRPTQVAKATTGKRRGPTKRDSKLCRADVDRMRNLSHEGMSYSKIGGMLGCSAATVSLCLNDKYPIPIDDKRH